MTVHGVLMVKKVPLPRARVNEAETGGCQHVRRSRWRW
jgi:hypothetical protein